MSCKMLWASRKELMTSCENAVQASADTCKAIDVILRDGIQQWDESNIVEMN